jgi:glycosyltransferase involved in cell wall biosynthesis
MKISACLIVLNEERNLPRCLASIAPVVDEIVVVDSASTDATCAIAARFQARIVQQEWLGFVAQKNFALNQATLPWVLSIDADEELSPELAEAIRRVKADPQAEAPGAPAGYEVSRLVYYRNRWIRHGDWYPDRLVRLFRREAARFTGGRVHEKLEIRGEVSTLPGHLHHYTYTDAADRARRCARYAELWARTAHEEHRIAGPLSAPLHALARWAKGYLLKRGFLDGAVGWDIAAGNAREVWLKYELLRHYNREQKAE